MTGLLGSGDYIRSIEALTRVRRGIEKDLGRIQLSLLSIAFTGQPVSPSTFNYAHLQNERKVIAGKYGRDLIGMYQVCIVNDRQVRHLSVSSITLPAKY